MNPTAEAVAASNPDAGVVDITRAYGYLLHYGYMSGALLSGAVNPLFAIDSLGSAVKEFQRVAGLPETGTLDQATLDKMEQPRCGVLDVQRMNAAEARWRKNRLTYFVRDYVNGIAPADQDDIYKLAWLQWTEIADLKLTQVGSASGADIILSTGNGRADGMDGPSGTLAWAYLPTGNDQQLLMRMDIAEQWVKAGNGILMLNVACHEFGHLLGLDHSKMSSALMAPFYARAISKPQAADDVSRIQALYGPATGAPTPPPAPKKVVISFEVENLTAVSIPGYKVIPA